METSVITARTLQNFVPENTNSSTDIAAATGKKSNTNKEMSLELNRTLLTFNVTKSNYTYSDNFTNSWNTTDFYYNVSSSSDLDYDYLMINGTLDDTSWAQCKEWVDDPQHSLFQTANFFFAAAFLVPGSFKQSVLLVRALLASGYTFLAIWGGKVVCARDILLWNSAIVALNCIHTGLLTWKFLPPKFTPEITELYLKVFKPLRVSKKHFKELVKEAKVMNLDAGDIYAVEDVSPADERLSILLKGRLKVTCDDTHLHFIGQHQFVDSPEWEANHEQSDNVFQVTITAEEESVFLTWSRMKLERVLRHRPMLKTVLDSVIGKDITQKLYALNEHLSGVSERRERDKRGAIWNKTHARSMSLDAVNTGTTGLVRSQAYKSSTRINPFNTNFEGCESPDISLKLRHCPPGRVTKTRIPLMKSEVGSTGKLPHQQQTFVPIVANQFPTTSPFIHQNSSNGLKVPTDVNVTPQRTKSFRKNREVKFINTKK